MYSLLWLKMGGFFGDVCGDVSGDESCIGCLKSKEWLKTIAMPIMDALARSRLECGTCLK